MSCQEFLFSPGRYTQTGSKNLQGLSWLRRRIACTAQTLSRPARRRNTALLEKMQCHPTAPPLLQAPPKQPQSKTKELSSASAKVTS